MRVRWHVRLLPILCIRNDLCRAKHAMDKDIPNFDELLEKGELLPIREWLTDKVHQYGALKKPFELLQEATGEGLNAKYLADYLQEKYTKLYQL